MKKLIIAGSRHINLSIENIESLLKLTFPTENYHAFEIVEGEARGVDLAARDWADSKGVTWKPFKADWDNLTSPNAVIRTRNGRKYNAKAGHDRNLEMAKYADELLLIWDGESPGSASMKKLMKGLDKPVHEIILRKS